MGKGDFVIDEPFHYASLSYMEVGSNLGRWLNKKQRMAPRGMYSLPKKEIHLLYAPSKPVHYVNSMCKRSSPSTGKCSREQPGAVEKSHLCRKRIDVQDKLVAGVFFWKAQH